MIKSLIKRERGEEKPGAYEPRWPMGNMWDAMMNMEKAFSDFFGETRPLLSRTGIHMAAVPLMDLYREADSYVVEVAVPGYRKDEIELHATEDSLTITGQAKEEKKEEKKTDGREIYWNEIKKGEFRRSVQFHEPVRPDRIKAVYKDGILKVTLPIEEPKKAKNIKIELE
jgi:HSP20 family protein